MHGILLQLQRERERVMPLLWSFFLGLFVPIIGGPSLHNFEFSFQIHYILNIREGMEWMEMEFKGTLFVGRVSYFTKLSHPSPLWFSFITTGIKQETSWSVAELLDLGLLSHTSSALGGRRSWNVPFLQFWGKTLFSQFVLLAGVSLV